LDKLPRGIIVDITGEMNGPEYFLSCDWGTTSFRLRHVRGSGEIIREVRAQTGARALHEEAAREGGEIASARAMIFSRFLRDQLQSLFSTGPNEPLALVISGMASSSVGWRELPYGSVPFNLDGQNLIFESLQWEAPAWIKETFLISGMATGREMMRGEEMEILGLMSIPELASCRRGAVLILPGTHSKHVHIREGMVCDFQTYMTGELFEVLGRHSLLRASVAPEFSAGADALLAEENLQAFSEGVRLGSREGLAKSLFRVRTRTVLEGRAAVENTFFFSGLLIGAELEEITSEQFDLPLALGATARFAGLYQHALELLNKTAPINFIQIPPDDVERASILGQAIFLKTQRLKAL
jgi:2-dehydro-3-deoxygalactonokinase